MEREGDCDTNCNRYARYSDQRIGTSTGRIGKKNMSRDHPNDSIVNIGQNTEKSSGDFRSLAVTHTGVKNSQKR